LPSPCGLYSQCDVVSGEPQCSCLPNHIGRPPYCRPECVTNDDCSEHLVCSVSIQKCVDPCDTNACGINADCVVKNHLAMCFCPPGYTDDPFTICSPVEKPIQPVKTDPCYPSPCGPNAICSSPDETKAICKCANKNYVGNPFVGCRPECVDNSECAYNEACINNKCGDPCSGSCGVHAICKVTNHVPSCYCEDNYTGNPFTSCQRIVDPPGKGMRRTLMQFIVRAKSLTVQHLIYRAQGALRYSAMWSQQPLPHRQWSLHMFV
jgi:hypothetical protein